MTTPTPTPRTDAIAKQVSAGYGGDDFFWAVPATLARQLETELSHAKAELKRRVAELQLAADKRDEFERCSVSLVEQLRAENAELKRDRERLDWLDRIDDGAFDWFNHPRNVRAAIDAAREGSK